WPGLVRPEELDKLVAEGNYELNRGLVGTPGVPAITYARELVKGPLYPGTLCAFGSGIHLASPSEPDGEHWPKPNVAFPRASKTACKYACGHDGKQTGVILRCVLRKDARVLQPDGIVEIRRENRNRAREAQLLDCGALTAALGFDAFMCEDL